MRRRRFLWVTVVAGSVLASGCLGGRGDGGTTEPHDSTQVTTTSGDDVVVIVAQIVIREADDGPHVYYQLRNDGTADATVAVRTVYTIDDGGTYEATAYVDVLAGEAVTLDYRLVRFEVLSVVERENVRGGNADIETYVNGERRAV